jgi:cytochrome b subunit of formate dehydrogenase
LKLERFEQWLRQTTPTLALVAFCIPILIVLPINFVAFGLLAQGLILKSILMEALAKLLATLLIARVFALTKPQLLTFSFLRITYTTIMRWLQWAHQKIIEINAYRWAKQIKSQIQNRH